MVDQLYDDAEKALNEKLTSSPDDKVLIRLKNHSQNLTINILEKLISEDCPEEIVKISWILMIRCYFQSRFLCDNINEFYNICQELVCQSENLEEMKDRFFNYLEFRLSLERLNPDKLMILKFIHYRMNDKKDLVFNIGRMSLNEFYENYLNIPNILEVNEYYDGKLIGVLILETYLIPGYLDVEKVVDLYYKLKSQIDFKQIISIKTFNNAVSLLSTIGQFFNLPMFNATEFLRIKSDFSTILTKLYNMPNQNFDTPIHNLATSIDDLDNKATKFDIVIEHYKKICIYDKGGISNDPDDIKIYMHDIPEGESLILKQYTLKNRSIRIRSILMEIKANEVAETIRKTLGDKTCFLQYFGINKDEEKLYLVMKHGGQSFSDILTKNQNRKIFSFSENELKDNFKRLIRSFYELKKQGIFHSDIKSQNLLVNDDKKVYIIDYNCCRIVDKKDIEPAIKGTSSYASPELSIFLSNDIQVKSFRYDVEKSDVFSLGIIFMEMIFIKKLTSDNIYDKIETLYAYLDRIDFEWAKILITDMIKIDPWDRPFFEELNGKIDRLIKS